MSRPEELQGSSSAPCELEFEQGTYHATFEVTVAVVRKGSLIGDISVQYTTKNATAKGGREFGLGVDYISKFGTLTFKDGECSKEITILVDDDVVEKNFCIYLKNQSSGATLGENGVAVVMVTGEDILDVSCQTIGEQEANELLRHPNVYTIQHRSRALAVIMNNNNFDRCTDLTHRDGSLFDEEHLTLLFEALHFAIYCRTDLTAKKMRTVFQELSKRDYTNYDALFVCVMSHGTGYNSIYGTDGKTIHAQKEIIHPFWKNATLKNKPKVFLFESNRELNSRRVSASFQKDGPATVGCAQGVTARSQLATDAIPELNSRRVSASFQKDGPATVGCAQGVTARSQLATDAIPEQAMDTIEDGGEQIVDSLNTLRISAAAPGTIPFREITGSWFIRSFVKVTARYAHREDLRSIMYRVRDLLGRKVANIHLGEEYQMRQCIEIQDSGFKTLYLLPGYPPRS